MLTTPAGMPASRASSPNRSIPNGASSGGFTTTALPAARAGPHFWPMPTIEPFHGGMTPTTPYGRRRTVAVPRATGSASSPTVGASPA